MRIFAIRDETLPEKTLGYLVYYETSKAFYIELSDDADPWETPPVLSSFVNRGIYSIDSTWSRRWVRQRIVPQDRQNIGQILRDNGLKEYDEFSLLMLTMGRCCLPSPPVVIDGLRPALLLAAGRDMEARLSAADSRRSWPLMPLTRCGCAQAGVAVNSPPASNAMLHIEVMINRFISLGV